MKNEIVPKIKKSIEDFLYEEEGNITRKKVLTVGSMMLIMGVIMSIDAFASHSSHKSHSSHSSHKSSSSGSGHSSHVSHVSHTSHSSSSTGTHSSSSTNSGSVGTHSNSIPSHTNVMPSMSGVALKTPPATEDFGLTENVITSFSLPDTPKIK